MNLNIVYSLHSTLCPFLWWQSFMEFLCSNYTIVTVLEPQAYISKAIHVTKVIFKGNFLNGCFQFTEERSVSMWPFWRISLEDPLISSTFLLIKNHFILSCDPQLSCPLLLSLPYKWIVTISIRKGLLD